MYCKNVSGMPDRSYYHPGFDDFASFFVFHPHSKALAAIFSEAFI